MPMIRRAVEEVFPNKVRIEQPNLAVAKGAALSAAIEWNYRVDELNRKLERGEEITPEDNQSVGVAPETPIEPGQLGKIENVTGTIETIKDRLTRSLGPAVFVDDDRYMIDNLLFVGDKIPAEAEAVYGTKSENSPEIIVNVYENVSEDHENTHVTPSRTYEGEEQYTDPNLKVKHIGEVHLKLPPNTPKGSPIRVVFRSSTVGLEVTATNVTTNESAKTVIESDVLYSSEQLNETKKIMDGIQTSGEI